MGKEWQPVLSPSLCWSLCQPIEPFNLDKESTHLTNSDYYENGIVVENYYVVGEANDDDNVIEKKPITLWV